VRRFVRYYYRRPWFAPVTRAGRCWLVIDAAQTIDATLPTELLSDEVRAEELYLRYSASPWALQALAGVLVSAGYAR
jgi:hypothetical protein